MNTIDLCVVCRVNMSRGSIVRIIPCRHLFHQQCILPVIQSEDAACPICRCDITSTDELVRRKNNTYAGSDRARVVECSLR